MAKFTQDVGEKLVPVGEVTVEVSLQDIKEAVTEAEVVEMAAEYFAVDPSGFLGALALKSREVEAESLDDSELDEPEVDLSTGGRQVGVALA